jgi:RNA polymerase sigma-70 factor, ECF subfamily
MDDEAVIEAVLVGETARFNELVRAYEGRLMGSLVAVLGSRQDAEDVAQETFVTAFRKLADFQRRCSFFSWLHKIGFHLAIDLKRKEKKHSQAIHTDDFFGHASQENPIEAVEVDEMKKSVYRALQMLDPERRMILTLRDLQEMSYEEISECLSIPIGTVRSRLHRARIEFKEILLANGVWGNCP